MQLLDVNVLVALAWPSHSLHAVAQTWFARHAKLGWATCPVTQAGFVRIVSNPAFSRDAVPVRSAIALLEASLDHPFHEFVADSIPFAQAVRDFAGALRGHRQVTDAYLLGLAVRSRAVLITFDRGLAALAAEQPRTARAVEYIGG